MELPFLWEISIPFTFFYLPLTIAYGNCISACILLAEARMKFVRARSSSGTNGYLDTMFGFSAGNGRISYPFPIPYRLHIYFFAWPSG